MEQACIPGAQTRHMEKQEMEMKWKLEMETGNGNWKQKLEQKTHQSLVQYFLHSVLSHYSCILLSNGLYDWLYESCFALTHVLCPIHILDWGWGGGNGWELGYCTQIGPGYEATINLLNTLHAIKTESGSRNEAARVGMLALFQNKVGYSMVRLQLAQTLSNVNQTRLQHCLRHEHYLITLGAVITKHSTRVNAKHMTHKPVI